MADSKDISDSKSILDNINVLKSKIYFINTIIKEKYSLNLNKLINANNKSIIISLIEMILIGSIIVI